MRGTHLCSHHLVAKKNSACCTAAGEAPCIATYWVTRYWQLLLLRLLTGLSLGGILPLVLSLLGDLFSACFRRRRASCKSDSRAELESVAVVKHPPGTVGKLDDA